MTLELSEDAGTWRLNMECNVPEDSEPEDFGGGEPNGYFWEAVAELVGSDVFERLELDSDAQAFCAYGDEKDLRTLKRVMDPYVSDTAKLRQLVATAEADGFEFDN